MTVVQFEDDHELCDEQLRAAKKEAKKWRMLARDAAALLGEQLDDEEEWSHAHCNEDAAGNHTLDQKWWEADAKVFIAKIDELTA